MNIITWFVLIGSLLFGISTLSKAYPNYYLYIAIFTLVYIFLLKVNEAFVNYKTTKKIAAGSDNEPSSLLKTLISINKFSTFMHVANCICIIGVISGWNLLMQGHDIVGILFIAIAATLPMGAMYVES